MDEERFCSAALYGLAASPSGAGPLLDNDGAALRGMRCGQALQNGSCVWA